MRKTYMGVRLRAFRDQRAMTQAAFAERLGLSQLHQLRGRVGRGSAQSDCVLLYQAPLAEAAQHRLRTMRETTDGFVIAERDLEQRGPGEVLGTRQTGVAGFRIADLAQHALLMQHLRKRCKRKHHNHANRSGQHKTARTA